jgi:NADH:ubiquinone reductase (H+-translocating)
MKHELRHLRKQGSGPFNARKTIDDARALRERSPSACELAERSESDEVRQRRLTTVIIGGGATGVEMSGAVAELSLRPAGANSTTYGSNCCSSF